ncbi:MAG TPA: hydrogenase maturation protease [Ktedonobacterales bacterium]
MRDGTSLETDLEAERSPRPIRVIGVGNDYRGGDAVGLLVARRLRERDLPDVEVLESGGAADELIAAWQGARAVILVDAVAAATNRGSILRLNAIAMPVPLELFTCSTYAFGVAQAIGLAGALGMLPPRLTLVGVVGGYWVPGTHFSDEVAGALPLAEHAVLATIEQMRLAEIR